MKKFRLYFYLFCVFLMCLMCIACQARDPDNLFEMTDGFDTTTVNSDKKDRIGIYYQYGNMQKNVPAGDFMQVGDEVLFMEFIDGKSMIFTYNMISGEVSTLCKNATCTHSTEDEECGLATLLGNLEYYDGEIYAMNSNFQVVQWQSGQMKPIQSGTVSSFWHSAGDLYIKTSDASLLVYKDGLSQSQMLIEEHSSRYDVIFDNYLYSHQSNRIVRTDLRTEEFNQEVLLENVYAIIDGEHIYFSPQDSNYLYRCDINGENTQLLLEQEVLPASWNFDDYYFYFRLYTDGDMNGPDSHKIYRLAKENPTNIEVLVELPEPVYQIFTVPSSEKIFVKSVTTQQKDGSNHASVYVVTIDGRTVKALDLPN